MRFEPAVQDVNTRLADNRLLLVALAALLPAVQLLAMAVAPRDYGYFIDEFYYVACAKRLAFGYVDHPPLAPALLAATLALVGDSMFAIRLPAILAGGATVYLVGRTVEELGGGRFAVVLACLAFGLAPVTLAMSGFFSMNAFEPLLWTALMLTLVRVAKGGDSRLWLLAGVLGGLAFENKHTALAYLAALSAGVVLSGMRRALRDPYLWAGAAIALIIALPNVLWQLANGWPSLEFYRNAQFLKNVPSPPIESLAAQALVMNPVALPLWLAGLAALLFARGNRHLRFAGLMFVVLLALHVASRTSRPDRMAAAYPIVFAAGAVVVERYLRRPVARAAWVALLVVAAAPLAFLALPILPPATEARVVAALGLEMNAERGRNSSIPQLLADRTGWVAFVDRVEAVYRGLSREEQPRTIIYAPAYGLAGALELLGARRGLPRVIGSHNSYWHWSDGHVESDVLIAVDASETTLRTLYRDVRLVNTLHCDYCRGWRDNLTVHVARGPIQPVQSVWARARHYE